jgi:hypothetical protein
VFVVADLLQAGVAATAAATTALFYNRCVVDAENRRKWVGVSLFKIRVVWGVCTHPLKSTPVVHPGGRGALDMERTGSQTKAKHWSVPNVAGTTMTKNHFGSTR